MGSGCSQGIGLLSLIQIVSVKSVVKWFGSYQNIFDHGWDQDGRQDWELRQGGEKMKL